MKTLLSACALTIACILATGCTSSPQVAAERVTFVSLTLGDATNDEAERVADVARRARDVIEEGVSPGMFEEWLISALDEEFENDPRFQFLASQVVALIFQYLDVDAIMLPEEYRVVLVGIATGVENGAEFYQTINN